VGGAPSRNLPLAVVMNDPLVTVLMTVYNAGRYLDAAIASIAAQTFRDWEFVIVDDASTDGSPEVAEAWAKRDSRIRVIRNAVNKGQTPCLNQGLREARGRWIARQDADDLSLPERLERQLAAADGFALLGTNGWIIDAAQPRKHRMDAAVFEPLHAHRGAGEDGGRPRRTRRV
jgi:glycosyltransferase involved in cell wall biosynthesis